MAFKMKGWSPFDKKIKKEESFTDKEESYMDRVYAQVEKDMGDSGTTFSAVDIANMSEKERAGNIDGYEPGDFARMVAEAKKKVKKNPLNHRIPEPFKGNYGQAHHNMDFDSDTSEGKKEHYKRNKH